MVNGMTEPLARDRHALSIGAGGRKSSHEYM